MILFDLIYHVNSRIRTFNSLYEFLYLTNYLQANKQNLLLNHKIFFKNMTKLANNFFE